jgi:type IV secretory pathway component VirB8
MNLNRSMRLNKKKIYIYMYIGSVSQGACATLLNINCALHGKTFVPVFTKFSNYW